MKTLQKIVLFLTFFFLFPMFSKAITTEEASEIIESYIFDSITTNEWVITNNKNSPDFYDIQISVGVMSNEDFSTAYKNINGASVLIINCGGRTNYKECDQNIEAAANFKLEKENDHVFLRSTLISQAIYNKLKSADSFYYFTTVNRKGLFKGKLETEGTYDNPKKENFTQTDNEEGRISNPKIIGTTGDIIIPIEAASFWDNAGSNKCYYFKFDYSDESDSNFARYKINTTASGSIQNYIFWANDPNYTLATSLIEDAKTPGVFGVSSSNVYGICNAYGTKFDFQFLDTNSLVVGNHLQKEESDKQNGEGSSTIYDNSTYEPDPVIDKDLCEGDNCDISLSGLCNEPKVARTLQFLGVILFIVKIFVPFLIIVLGSVDFAKAMIDGKNDEIPKKIPVLIKRVIAGIVVFLIPSIINFLFGVIDTYSETMQQYDNCRVCIFEPDNCNIRD